LTLLASIAVLNWVGGIPIWATLVNDPWQIVYWGSTYVGLGVGWSVFKWWRLLLARRREFDEKLESWILSEGIPHEDALKIRDGAVPEVWREKYLAWTVRESRYSNSFSQPQARDFKGRITSWMAWWPWSLLWTGFRTFVLDLFNKIFEELKDFYDKIARSVFRGVPDTEGW